MNFEREGTDQEEEPEKDIGQKKGGWIRGSIEGTPKGSWGRKQPEGGRDIITYETILGFRKEDLEDKRVLDLGAGPTAKFSRDLEAAGVRAQVVELSPDFFYKKYAENVKDKTSVAGLGQDLPFRDESFDAIFALHVWEHIYEEERLPLLEEVARVLSVGGKASIGIIDASLSDFNNDPDLVRLSKKLKTKGVSMKGEEIDIKGTDYKKVPIYDLFGNTRIGWKNPIRIILEKKKKLFSRLKMIGS